MRLEILQYTSANGWSKSFPAWDSPQTLVLIFSDPEYLQAAHIHLENLFQTYANSKIIGCSTAGEIFADTANNNSISVAILKFSQTNLQVANASIEKINDSYPAGKKLAQVLNKQDLRGILIFANTKQINASEVVRGLNEVINNQNIVITGGLAGDNANFKQTWTLLGNKITSNSLVAIGFYGNKIHLGHAVQSGWENFGPERRITRAEQNVLYELDARPVLPLYKEYLGEKSANLPATGVLYPLAIKGTNVDTQLVRSLIGIDTEEQALMFAGTIPLGQQAQLMRTSHDRLLHAAHLASAQALGALTKTAKIIDSDTPLFLLTIGSFGRRLLFGERTDEETATILKVFPSQTKQIGFYGYGEFSSWLDINHQTITITAIAEEENAAQ